ncbi:MAG: RloB family protein [Pseudonocardiaceae bacterium]
MSSFCEGEASEPDYINGLKRLPNVHGNTSINIEVDPRRGVPLTLVDLAINQAADDEVDECWCVFDVEWPKNHPNLQKAIQLARDHNIRLVISNPCFELWLILHFEDQTAFLATKEAESKSRKLDGRSGKRIDTDQYISLRHVAARRASSLSCRHEQDQTLFPHNNPSSTMNDLLTTISAMEPCASADMAIRLAVAATGTSRRRCRTR